MPKDIGYISPIGGSEWQGLNTMKVF